MATNAVELCRFLEEAQPSGAVIDERSLRSLLHGDLKPRSVRITADGQVKVLDFGIAKALSLSRKVTRNDFGSVAYLSPERLESGEVDAHTDFWAVGVLLYEMVSGAPPFRAADTRRLERQILSRCPPPPLEGTSIGLQGVVAKLLSPRVAERYETAQAIGEDLERVASGATTRAEQEGWPGRAVDDNRHAPNAAPLTPRIRSRVTAPASNSSRLRRPKARRTRERCSGGPIVLTADDLQQLRVARAADRVERRCRRRNSTSWAICGRATTNCRITAICASRLSGSSGLDPPATALADRVIADYARRSRRSRAQWKKAQEALARPRAGSATPLKAALRATRASAASTARRKARRQTATAHAGERRRGISEAAG